MKFIHKAKAKFGFAHYVLQFLIEKFIALAPVDAGMSPREEKGDKFFKDSLEYLLPEDSEHN